jgi:hypothetical protein
MFSDTATPAGGTKECSPRIPGAVGFSPMRRKFPVFFVSSLIFACGPGLRAQLLWPGTLSGQPVEDVQRLFPEAHAPDEPMGLPRGRGIELLKIDSVPIGGKDFTVRFYFKDRQLVHVALSAIGEISFKDFEKFRDLLRKKYEMERSTVNSEYLLVTWKIAQTTIELKWTPKSREIATLTITYDAPISKGKDLL